jgi:hypothetical protein
MQLGHHHVRLYGRIIEHEGAGSILIIGAENDQPKRLIQAWPGQDDQAAADGVFEIFEVRLHGSLFLLRGLLKKFIA